MPTLTTNYSFTKSTVAGDEAAWGGHLNGNWDALDEILHGTVSAAEIRPKLSAGNWKIGPTTVTATAADLNKIAGLATTATELGYVAGVTGPIQTQINAKANAASPALTGTPTAPTAAPGTNTTQIATTAFVTAAVASGGQDLTPYAVRASNLSDLTNPVAARQNLGGTATGISLFTAADQAAGRAALGLGSLATLNSIAPITTSEIAAATLVTAAEGIVSNDNDTTIPTSAAVKAYADSVASAGYTDAQARSAQAAHLAGGVGSYMFATTTADTNTDYNFGDTIAGSGLRPCGAYTNDTGSIIGERLSATVPAGTWRCMGYCENSAAGAGENTMTLWLRIS